MRRSIVGIVLSHEEPIMSDSTRLFAFVVIAGMACGGALVGTSIITRNGWAMLLPYIVLGVIFGIFLRNRRIETFSQRFFLPFAAYVLATLIINGYILTIVNPQRIHQMSLWSVFGPLLAMLLIGAAGSLVVAAASRFPSAGNGQLRASARL